MTKHDLSSGILQVDLHVFQETVSLEFFDTSNGIVSEGGITMFFDELESLRDLLTSTLDSLKKPEPQRIISKDQQILSVEGAA